MIMNFSFLGHHAVDILHSVQKKKRKKGERALPLVSDKPIRSVRDQEQSAAISLQAHKLPSLSPSPPDTCTSHCFLTENVTFTFRVHTLCSAHPVHR